MSTTTNTLNGSLAKLKDTKITLYTNHKCPWAHRAHIAVRELGLPFEEVIIDLAKPREQWYLDINPRGLVPTIKFSGGAVKDQIITESGVVSRFLTDAFPSHLAPISNADEGQAALFRARADFFVDAWFSKVIPKIYAGLTAEGEEREKVANELVDAISKEIEPLLADAKPFFGGRSRLTIAEVMTASFVVRLYSYSRDGQLLPCSVVERFAEKLPNFSRWADALQCEESVVHVYNERENVEAAKVRIRKQKETAAAAK